MRLKKNLGCLTAGLLMAFGATAETYHWDAVAMGSGGFVTGVIPSKSERGVVFARTDVGGAYRWEPQTGRWTALSNWLGESDTGLMGAESLAIDPRNAANVYILAGTSYFSNGKTVIMRSNDYGRHFTLTDVTAQFKAHGNGMGRQNGEKLQVDPGSGNVLFVGTRRDGLFKSTDSGATWTRVNGLNVTSTPNDNGISFVLLDPASVTQGTAKRIYVGVSRFGTVGPNLYFSKDGGVSFAPVAGAPSGLMPQRAAITAKGRLYLTYANGAGPHQGTGEPMTTGQMWEYNSVGGAWTNITPAGYSNAFGGISVDPGNPKHLVASTINTWWTQQQQPATYGDRIFTSLDAGRSWTDVVGRGMTVDPNGMEWSRSTAIHWAGSIEFDPFDPKTVWVVSGQGLFKTSDIDATTSSWKFDTVGMEETGVYAAESIPGGPLMTVTGDVDGFLNSAPDQYGPRHTPNIGTNTGMAVAAQAPHVLARVGWSQLYVSTNMGASWQPAPSVKGGGGNLALSADGFVLLHSPDSSSTSYRSTDFGANWTAVVGLAVNNANPVADKVNPAKFYVYDKDSGQLLVSSDGGASFSPKARLAAGGSTWVRTTPGRDGDLWVCLDSKGLSHSTDSGATFTSVAGINACAAMGLGKEAPGADYPTLYMWGAVGSARGMLRSTDQGAHWDRINDDQHQYGGPLSGAWVTGDMNTYGTVYMSTNGRGSAYGKIDPDGDVQVVPQVPAAPGGGSAECKYVVTNGWWGGHMAEVRITNQGASVIHGWTVNWRYSDNSSVSSAWNGVVTGTAPNFSATDGQGWNHDIYPGQTATVGMVVGGQVGPDFTAIPAVTGDVCK
ncbi:cellulose binding domain-containing protein [Rugamonas rivuli]|nr:cellulose binding domain-containing protein [Rugamonas rivuli]